MHFNVKHIFNGDSEKEIKDKINYNFNQILSFAIGPNGHQGPKGAAGLDGPGGFKGATGPTGLRASLWYKQNVQPGSSSNPFDLWIDSESSDYSVYTKGATGSWSYTGYSLFNSLYFQTYSGIVGPAGVTDKYAIGLKSGAGLTASSTSLVISDKILGSSNSNPNRSKVLIATEDQTTRPILDFSKSGAISTGTPGFYWRYTGTGSDLRFASGGSLNISSLLGLTVDSYTASSILYGNYATINAVNNISIQGVGNFGFYSNTTVGVGGNFTLSSSNLFLSSVLFSSADPITISPVGGSTGGYVYNTVKNLPSGVTTSSAGIELISDSTQDYTFEFRDLKGAPVLSGKARGPVSSGKYAQLTFGNTGGQAGGATGGPYFYHVKKVNETKQSAGRVYGYFQNSVTPSNSSSLLNYADNVFDLSSPSIWSNDQILITALSASSYYDYTKSKTYIRIPSSPYNTLEGVYYNGTSNHYRVMLNDTTGYAPYYIAGIVYTFFRLRRGLLIEETYVVEFDFLNAMGPNTCQYVDIFYAPIANLNNGNPRVFWKTCNGLSGYISLTNNASVGSVVSNPSINNTTIMVTTKTTVVA